MIPRAASQRRRRGGLAVQGRGRPLVGGGDAGSIAPAVPVIAMMLFLLAGLVVDSARQLDARSRAVAYAEEAARAGAQRIQLNSETALLDDGTARAAVAAYCARVLAADAAVRECGVTALGPARLGVRVRLSTPATMLSAVGVGPLTATGEAEAIPEQGVTGPDEYPGVPSPSVTLSEVPLPIEVGEPDPSPTQPNSPSPTSPSPSDEPSPSPTDGQSPSPSGDPSPSPTDGQSPSPTGSPEGRGAP